MFLMKTLSIYPVVIYILGYASNDDDDVIKTFSAYSYVEFYIGRSKDIQCDTDIFIYHGLLTNYNHCYRHHYDPDLCEVYTKKIKVARQ